jgi:small subunit ribosomal protein S16
VATKIRLLRLGKIRAPYYRIVVADARTKRDGRVIETIGKYHPKEDPSFIEVNSDRARYWLSVGAQPTEPVAAILKITGDWQAHKGLPAPEVGLKTAAPRPDRKAIFEAAAKETLGSGDDAPAKKTAKKSAKKAAAKQAEPAAADTEAGTADSAASETAAPEAAAPEAAAPEAAAPDGAAAEAAGDTATDAAAEPPAGAEPTGEPAPDASPESGSEAAEVGGE